MPSALPTVVIDRVRACVNACKFPGSFFSAGESLHFDHGHMRELVGKLARKNLKKLKYPLVILVEDIDNEVYGGMIHCDLRLFIVNLNTDLTADSPKRWKINIKPRLLPMYLEFIKQVSRRFSWDKENSPGNFPPHTWTALPQFGVWLQDKGTYKNMLSDPLDAIEIKNLKVNVKALTCEPLLVGDESGGVIGDEDGGVVGEG